MDNHRTVDGTGASATGLSEALWLSEQRYQSLVAATEAVVWITDPRGWIREPCPAWQAFTGQTWEQYRAMGWADAIHPEDRQRISHVLESIAGDPPRPAEFRVRHRGGDWRHITARGATVTDDTGRVREWVLVGADTTTRNQAEGTLRTSNDDLRQLAAERLGELEAANQQLRASNRELEDFAAVASHDLQEPLRKIQAFGDRLEAFAGAALGAEGRDYLARMRKAAARMQHLIGDLLQFSRITTHAHAFVAVDLNETLAGVLSDLEITIEQDGGRVEFGALPTVQADATQMRQLLQNLISNGLKFHKAGVGPVVEVFAETSSPDSETRIVVRDNGIGFDEKYLDRIFNVFQRLHARTEYEGTGIGLAVCRKIVHRHGGSITASSTPGAGAAFVVRMPLRQTSEETFHAS